ncbi:type II toxin-antitoxin system PemK/MazF family toxin [Microbacterium sp. ET2]|nr:type II toxin-antitoxin system PemK/MazF family toxin [Microbacterium sp. ET2 (Ac-2212)]WJL97385.1 type II toxin-antitoxin system PemK/MazF family toxin [Microbacterium sp. ET2 (Ac-2212)]
MRGLLGAVSALFGAGRRERRTSRSTGAAPSTSSTATQLIVRPPRDLTIEYRPDPDGTADAGEIVWTWVPYVENDGRGKDRPVLVIGRGSADRVYAVRLTSRAHDGDHGYLPLGTGEWDSRGRASWVDIDQLYSVHERGMRREAAALDLQRFTTVAEALRTRYGWRFSAPK